MRVVIFESPSIAETVRELERAYPTLDFRPEEIPSPEQFMSQGFWDSRSEGTRIPVYGLSVSAEELRSDPHKHLTDFFLPICVTHERFCVTLAFGKDEIRPAKFDVSQRGKENALALDIADLDHFMSTDCLRTNHSEIELLPLRELRTPIERDLSNALQDAGISHKTQVPIGRYVVDFLLRRGGANLVVEADGREFHDKERDRRRDEELVDRHGIGEVIRFTGSEIYGDAAACAEIVGQWSPRGVPSSSRVSPERDLDSSQLAAMSTEALAVRVLAPAGSGKTKTLVNRVAHLIGAQGVNPSSILVLAFNKKAEVQLSEKLESFGIGVRRRTFDPEDFGVACCTFNAFGSRYLRWKDWPLTLPGNGADAATRRTMGNVFSRLRRDIPGRVIRGADPVSQLMSALRRVRANLEPPANVDVEFETVEGNASIWFDGPYESYCQEQQRQRDMDFDDQVFFTVKYLAENPDELRFLQRRFRYVLVDEFQDLNPTQLLLVDMLSRPHRNLFAVGDDDQLIYGWRFAKLGSILGFHDLMPSPPFSATHTLEVNYRSSKAIVERSQLLIEHNRNREPKRIRPKEGAPEGLVRYVREETFHDRMTVVQEFLKAAYQRTERWGQTAVLVRTNAALVPIALALREGGIPHTSLESQNLGNTRAGRVVLAHLSLLRADSPAAVVGDDLSLALKNPNRYVPNEILGRIAESEDPWNELTRFVREQGTGRRLGADEFATLLETTRRKLRPRGFLEPNDGSAVPLFGEISSSLYLEAILEDMGVRDSLVGQSAGIEADASSDQEVIESLGYLAQELPNIDDFVAHLERDSDAEDGSAKEEDEDVVDLLTIHRAKGREYESVVIFDYDPSLKSTEDEADLEEERRVLYVAITRGIYSNLITIDGSEHGEINRLIAESMKPPVRGDEAALCGQELRSQISERRDIARRGAGVVREIREIENGTKVWQMRRQLEALQASSSRTRSRIETQQLSVREADTIFGRLFLRHRSQRNVLEELMERLRAVNSEIEGLQSDIAILEESPEIELAPLEASVEKNNEELRANADHGERLKARIEELSLDPRN